MHIYDPRDVICLSFSCIYLKDIVSSQKEVWKKFCEREAFFPPPEEMDVSSLVEMWRKDVTFFRITSSLPTYVRDLSSHVCGNPLGTWYVHVQLQDFVTPRIEMGGYAKGGVKKTHQWGGVQEIVLRIVAPFSLKESSNLRVFARRGTDTFNVMDTFSECDTCIFEDMVHLVDEQSYSSAGIVTDLFHEEGSYFIRISFFVTGAEFRKGEWSEIASSILDKAFEISNVILREEEPIFRL